MVLPVQGMAKLRELIEEIIEDLARLQTTPVSHRDESDGFRLPRMIAAGDGGSLIVSRTIDDSIVTIADRLMDADATLASKYTRAEWRASVRRAFGPVLASIDLEQNLETSASTVLTGVQAALYKNVSSEGVREFTFGCTLFDRTAIQPFAIGPVRFEGRLTWLARKHDEGAVSTISRRRVEQAWAGKRLSKRKPSHDSHREAGILDTIGAGAFVCSVATNGLGVEAGREKALTAARLATAAIALLWQTPSKALEGLNLLFDRVPHRQRLMAFAPGKIVLVSSNRSHMPHSPSLTAGEWEKLFSEWGDHFDVTADALHYVLTPSEAVARPNMMNTLAQALLWFHEGCRETVTLMAIVKFAAALDALACGHEAGGIQQLISARLGIEDAQPIRPGGPTLRQAIKHIYGEGRSRTIHGTNDKLGHDWTGTRGLAEQFCRLCLCACIDWIAKNPSCDDPLLLSA